MDRRGFLSGLAAAAVTALVPYSVGSARALQQEFSRRTWTHLGGNGAWQTYELSIQFAAESRVVGKLWIVGEEATKEVLDGVGVAMEKFQKLSDHPAKPVRVERITMAHWEGDDAS